MIKTTLICAAVALAGASCIRIKSDPVEVKPIHIVMDVNIRIDRQLEEFFDFEETAAAPATQAATQSTAGR